MDKSNSKGGLVIGILIGIIIMLVVFIGLFATNTISFSGKISNDEQQTSGNKEENNKKIYSAGEYVSLEDYKVTDKYTIKKVKFNHLDDNVTKEFYDMQNKILNNLYASNEDYYTAEHKVEYYINNNILSVLYMVEETNAIGTCATTKAVTNIDLLNNKVLSEEELLSKVNMSYEKIINKYYDDELSSWSKNIDENGHVIDSYEIKFDDFKNNKDKYIKIGLDKIDDVIYTYIKDGHIKYDYYTIDVEVLFHSVGKGGCFTWKTEDLGEY